MDNRNQYDTRRSLKGLLPITYNQTVTKVNHCQTLYVKAAIG